MDRDRAPEITDTGVDGAAVRGEAGGPALDRQVTVLAAAPPLIPGREFGRGERVRVRAVGGAAQATASANCD